MVTSSSKVVILLLKYDVNLSGSESIGILILFSFVDFGKQSKFTSFAIFSAFRKDLELPGHIVLLTCSFFFLLKNILISTFRAPTLNLSSVNLSVHTFFTIHNVPNSGWNSLKSHIILLIGHWDEQINLTYELILE
jgi:hypothetical protein